MNGIRGHPERYRFHTEHISPKYRKGEKDHGMGKNRE